MEHAGFGSRFFAWLIDGIMMGILGFICASCAALAIGLAVLAEDSLLGWLTGLGALVQHCHREIAKSPKCFPAGFPPHESFRQSQWCTYSH